MRPPPNPPQTCILTVRAAKHEHHTFLPHVLLHNTASVIFVVTPFMSASCRLLCTLVGVQLKLATVVVIVTLRALRAVAA